MFDWNEFIQATTRIFNVSRKPGMNEYKQMAKVTGLGIILIGIMGFVIKLLLEGLLKI